MYNDDLYQVLEKIITEKLKYHKHYYGEVIGIKDTTSTKQEGLIRVKIPALGHENNNEAIWCVLRGLNQLLTPKVGDYVDVGFMEGDPDQPVCYGKINEYKDQLPESYDNKETNQVVFESTDSEAKIFYEESEKKLKMFCEELWLLSDQDNAVRYSELESAFNELKDDFNNFVTTIYNLHNHPSAPVGPVSTPSVTGSSSSADITGAKIDEILVP